MRIPIVQDLELSMEKGPGPASMAPLPFSESYFTDSMAVLTVPL